MDKKKLTIELLKKEAKEFCEGQLKISHSINRSN